MKIWIKRSLALLITLGFLAWVLGSGMRWHDSLGKLLGLDPLALMLAISRQTTNQILKELQAQGIVQLTYGEIEILDLQRLQQAAQA